MRWQMDCREPLHFYWWECDCGGCAHTGECLYDGDCFRTEVSAYRDAARKIRKLAEDESGWLRGAILEAAEHMDTMKEVARSARR